MRSASRKSFSARLRSPLARAIQPSFSKRRRERGLDAELLGGLADLLDHRLGRVELALDLQETGVRQRRADARADAPALAGELERTRQQELRLVELEPDDVRGASAWAAIVCRSLRPASSAITYARSMNRT